MTTRTVPPQAALRVHFCARLEERYGVRLSRREYARLCYLLARAFPPLGRRIVPTDHNREVRRLTRLKAVVHLSRGMPVPVVYESGSCLLVTALPWDDPAVRSLRPPRRSTRRRSRHRRGWDELD